MKAFADPDAFMADLSDWQLPLVTGLREAVLEAADFEETIKWGNLVFLHHGPCVLIHVEDHRALFGLMRGKRLCDLYPRIRPSGKYELGNIEFREGDTADPLAIAALARQASRLNAELVDPTDPRNY